MPNPSAGPRVLFVCTANIARSPYAERRARTLLAEGSAVRVASAGFPGVPGREMDPAMAHELRARGGDPEGHVSRVLDDAVMAACDLILTSEFRQHIGIVDRWPDQHSRVFGLGQFADAIEGATPADDWRVGLADLEARAGSDGMTWDVADPHRRGRRAARACARAIDDLLAGILPRLETWTDRAEPVPG